MGDPNGIYAPPLTRQDLRQAAQKGKPVLHSVTTHEAHSFALLAGDDPQEVRNMTYDNLRIFGISAAQVDSLAAYIQSQMPERSEQDVYIDVMTGFIFFYPHFVVSQEWSAQQQPVYHYQFDWPTPQFEGAGALHGLDLPFTFGNYQDMTFMTGDNPPAQIGHTIQDAISSFARNGKPEVAGQVWPVYDMAQKNTLVINETSRLQQNPVPWLAGYSERLEAHSCLSDRNR